MKLCLAVALLVALAHGQAVCSGFSPWDKMPNMYMGSDWDTKLADGQNIYPLGFKRATMKEFNQPPICVHVNNSRNRAVEIRVYTLVANQRVCARDNRYTIQQNTPGVVTGCDNGKLNLCFIGDTDTDLQFYIYCDGVGCEESDVELLYRVRLSDTTWSKRDDASDNVEMWCNMISGNDTITNFPDALFPDTPSNNPFGGTTLIGSGAAETTGLLMAGLAAFAALAAQF